MEHTVKTFAGVWYTINCTANATVTETIDDEIVPLIDLSSPGSATFRASGSQITIQTDGKFRVLPFT